ncbi:COX15/CtaA family protein [Crenobacter sp. SG2305]|uniref:COX15/CtaA family protein n=1 Tax=Crenobacter oryzisoli TaxID=3056844 RepID=UPI0025AAFB68|nr:COX15/CtaA family protein [Crenobacter sp. SG2305]MDN0084310.1 COX15/CtaA family protein [Crenobacter sp. SG2305]
MKRWIWLAFLLALLVVPLGAYVRLSHAGLGCPDWPGCYGQLSPAHAVVPISEAMSTDPGGPVSFAKAWKEMIHRYAASTLGLLIMVIALLAFRRRQQRLAAGFLLGAVLLQGMLGMWTVTLLLKPAIVTSHLLVGMTIVATLGWLALSSRLDRVEVSRVVLHAGWLLVALVLGQILLGGWTSANYAALACQGFPSCNGELVPALRFDHAFHLFRELGETPDGAPLDPANLVTIHWMHRLGALVVSLALWRYVWLGWRLAELRPRLLLLILVWAVQIVLGVTNVLAYLPLPVAVAHNAGAMLLLTVTMLVAGRSKGRSDVARASHWQGRGVEGHHGWARWAGLGRWTHGKEG